MISFKEYILESEESDSTIRKESGKFFKSFKKYFKNIILKNKQMDIYEKHHKIDFTNVGGKKVFDLEIEYLGHPKYKDLVLKIIQGNTYNGNYGNNIITLWIKSNAETPEQFVKDVNTSIPQIEQMIVHEFIHMLDEKKYKHGANPMKNYIPSKDDKQGYYNQSTELNPYIQQSMYTIEKELKNNKDVLKDFNTFYNFAKTKFHRGFFKNMTPDTEKRILKKLYRFFVNRGDNDKF
jgi:hypothetical protein